MSVEISELYYKTASADGRLQCLLTTLPGFFTWESNYLFRSRSDSLGQDVQEILEALTAEFDGELLQFSLSVYSVSDGAEIIVTNVWYFPPRNHQRHHPQQRQGQEENEAIAATGEQEQEQRERERGQGA